MESNTSRFSKFSKALIVLGILLVIAFTIMVSSVAEMVGKISGGSGFLGDKKPHLTVFKLEGPIFGSDEALEILSRISEDEQCKGLLVRVDSPGGAVGASQEIYSALRRLREKGLPLVVSMGNVAASGGYYVSLAGQTLFANPGTLTGSIGVILQFPEAEKLLDKIGISLQTIKSGALKDAGNFGRKATPQDLRYFQGVIDDAYDQFLNDVAENRRLPVDSVRLVADGRVLTGRQALKAGLVDTLGGLDRAKAFLIAKAKVAEDIHWLEEPKPKSRIQKFLDSESSSPALAWLTGLKEKINPGVFFLWR